MGVTYSHYLIPSDNTVRPSSDRIVALIDAWRDQGFIAAPTGSTSAGDAGADAAMGASFRLTHRIPAAPETQQAPRPKSLWARWFGAADRPAAPIFRAAPWTPFPMPVTDATLAVLNAPYGIVRWPEHEHAAYPMQTVTQTMAEQDAPPFHQLIIEFCEDFIDPHPEYVSDPRHVSGVCGCGQVLRYEQQAYLADEYIRRLCPACGAAFRPQDHMADLLLDGNTGETFVQPGGLCNRFGIIIDFDKNIPSYVVNSNGDLVETPPRVSTAFMDTCTRALGVPLNEFSFYS